MKQNDAKKSEYSKPEIVNRFTERDFLPEGLPSVRAEFKTYVPVRPEIQV